VKTAARLSNFDLNEQGWGSQKGAACGESLQTSKERTGHGGPNNKTTIVQPFRYRTPRILITEPSACRHRMVGPRLPSVVVVKQTHGVVRQVDGKGESG